ncbi:MAG: TraB/GumN family protein [Opitutus sp.]|nr:TraB/GumN family protein [Opitutus sp.]
MVSEKLFRAGTPDLATRLPSKLWPRLVRAGANLGLPELLLHQLTPGSALLLFSAPAETDPTATVDGQLYARAKDRNLTVAALESIDEQFAIFENLTDAQACAALAETLDEIAAGRPDDRKLLATYATGDERAVLAVVQAEFAKSAANRALAEPLLYHRNRLMVDRLSPRLGAGGAFVAIGVAHLIGPKSVIELLRARGYKITRVP